VVLQGRVDRVVHAKTGEMQHQFGLGEEPAHALAIANIHDFEAEAFRRKIRKVFTLAVDQIVD
jgi:hypothetical protein